MPDIFNAAWSETDASNNTASPSGWADSAAPSTVKQVGRMMMGALKRWFNLASPTYTTGGTSTALTLTPAVDISAYATGLTVDAILGSAIGVNATLNVSAKGDKKIYAQTQAGLRQTLANDARATNRVRFSYDATLDSAAGGWVMRDVPLAGATAGYVLTANGANAEPTFQAVAAPVSAHVTVRQTVLSGPVDSSGLPNFGGSTAGTAVTLSTTLIATAANGFDVNAAVDRVGSITNPSWTSLSTNGTMYLYLDIAADGTCTTGSTTLSPVYQFGGTYSTTSGQFTFNIQEMVGKVGNGSVATQTYRVFVGEVTVAGGVVSAIKWYALMGRYDSGLFAVAATTTYAKSHNLGFWPALAQVNLADDSAGTNERAGSVGAFTFISTNYGMVMSSPSRTSVSIVTAAGVGLNNAGTAGVVSGYARILIWRGW